MGQRDSEHKGERQRRQARQAAEAGKATGGGNRPFGYARDRVTVIDSEAAVVREAAARVLAGETLASVVRDLNRRGITTSSGGPWQSITLRNVLCSARISGRREHKPTGSYTGARPLLGEIVCEVAEWPPIITPADSDRLRALLSNPARRTSPGNARRYLLSGILTCGRCGRPMVARPRSDSSGSARYLCRDDPGYRGCGRVMIHQERTDDAVRDIVVGALADNPGMAERLARRDNPEPDLHARIRADEDALEELAADHGNGEITRAEWKAARAPIAARLDAARQRLTRRSHTSALDGFVGPLDVMLARWEQSNTSQRRAIVTAVVESITVMSAIQRSRFDKNRLRPVWHR